MRHRSVYGGGELVLPQTAESDGIGRHVRATRSVGASPALRILCHPLRLAQCFLALGISRPASTRRYTACCGVACSHAPMHCSRKRRSVGLRASASAVQEVFVRVLRLPTPKLKFAKRGVIERIAGEAIRTSDCTNLFQPAERTLALRDGDGAVERHDRREANDHQLVVERHDLPSPCRRRDARSRGPQAMAAST